MKRLTLRRVNGWIDAIQLAGRGEGNGSQLLRGEAGQPRAADFVVGVGVRRGRGEGDGEGEGRGGKGDRGGDARVEGGGRGSSGACSWSMVMYGEH